MQKLIAALALSGAAGLVAPSAPAPKAAPRQALADLKEGASNPFPDGWDPAGLADLGTPATLAWFRAAEIKHSRVAMAATVGWIIQETGITFPGKISLDGTTFASSHALLSCNHGCRIAWYSGRRRVQGALLGGQRGWLLVRRVPRDGHAPQVQQLPGGLRRLDQPRRVRGGLR